MVNVNIRVRQSESQDPQPSLLWDTQFDRNTQVWDWIPAGYGDPSNVGGFVVTRPIDTAVLIQLATWRRAEPYDVLPSGNDLQGWWGDSIDLDDNEGPLGSRLWLLYRSPLNDATAQRAKNYALEAMQTFITQGVFVTINVTPSFNPVQGWLTLQIDGYGQNGQQVYSQSFTKLWADEFAAFNPTPNFAGGTGP